MLDKTIKVVSADEHNKPDIAAVRAREWYDMGNRGVIVGVVPSRVALPVWDVGRQKGKVVLVSGAYISRLTNEQCLPFTVHYQVDDRADKHAEGAGKAGSR